MLSIFFCVVSEMVSNIDTFQGIVMKLEIPVLTTLVYIKKYLLLILILLLDFNVLLQTILHICSYEFGFSWKRDVHLFSQST